MARSRCALAVALCAIVATSSAGYAYQAETVKNGGTITGMVRYDGPPLKRALLEVSKDKDVCGKAPLYDQSLVIGQGGGIENAVVTITNVSKGVPLKPEKDVKFDQRGCEYTPHVVALPAGSSLQIINSDGILHSIHTESSINPVVDMAQPGFKKTISVTIEKPEVIKVTCDAHNWMEGWWYVVGNPYYAVTGPNGHFTIGNVPAGTYTLKVWQEKLGVETHSVTVKPGAAVAVDFTFKAK
jgi:plastocyanin